MIMPEEIDTDINNKDSERFVGIQWQAVGKVFPWHILDGKQDCVYGTLVISETSVKVIDLFLDLIGQLIDS